MNDQELLQAYVREGSQAAFAQLVERHVALVYSAARRLLGNNPLAEDVSQQVFMLLARKAAGLGPDTICSAWLYRTARHVASETLRGEARRRRREQVAVETMNQSAVEPGWRQLEPLLDEAMASLSPEDHDALVLRYFENLSLRDLGANLGASEDAAQKRVSRALERLRSCLAVRGLALSVAAIGTAISAGAIQPAPPGLAASAASAAVSAGAATSLIAQGAKMAVAHAKLLSAALVILALSLALVWVSRQNVSLRRQLAVSSPTPVEIAPPDSVVKPADSAELRQLRKERLELLSLRGRVAQLASELHKLQSASTNTAALPALAEKDGDSILFSAALTNRVPSGHTLVVGGWAQQGMRGYLLLTPEADAAATNGRSVKVQSVVVMAPDSFWNQIGWGPYKSGARRSTLAGVLTPEQADSLLQALKEQGDADISNTSLATGREGERMGVGFSMADDHQSGALMGIDFFPRLTADGQAIDVELSPSPVSADREIHPSLKAAGVGSPPSY